MFIQDRSSVLFHSVFAQMAETVEQKRSVLQQLKQREASLQEQLRERERDIKATNDRKERLKSAQKEHDELCTKCNETRDYNSKASAELAAFPSDTQVLKLERRVESLKEQLSESTRKIQQHRTGIDAYTVRRQRCAKVKAQLVKNLDETIAESVKFVTPKEEQEKTLQNVKGTVQCAETASGIFVSREEELQQLTKKVDELAKEETERTNRISELKAKGERELPLVDAERERDIAELTAEWKREQEYLQGLYDRLYVINKEQGYHLQRGTHIKKEAAPRMDLREAALSTKQAQLASALNDANLQLRDVKDDIAHQKRQADQLRSEGRCSHAQYQRQKAEAEERLKQAKIRCDEAEREAIDLRNLKAELQQTLQNIRECQQPIRSSPPTPRVSAPRAPSK